jgi:hypothetical protein
VKRLLVLVALVACKDREPAKTAPEPAAHAGVVPAAPAATIDANDMDEKMRHCPLTLAGAKVTYADVDRGVQFDIDVPANLVTEVQRRAHHVVEFAAGKAKAGTHGGGQGGGTMRNCPVVTSGVVIEATDVPTGARLVVTPLAEAGLADLRRESATRTEKFVFDGVTVVRR